MALAQAQKDEMSYLQKYVDIAADNPDKQQLLRDQHNQSQEGIIVCPCGWRRALTMAFRCLYCGIWFCLPCAEKHFNMSIQEWLLKREIERKTKQGEPVTVSELAHLL